MVQYKAILKLGKGINSITPTDIELIDKDFTQQITGNTTLINNNTFAINNGPYFLNTNTLNAISNDATYVIDNGVGDIDFVFDDLSQIANGRTKHARIVIDVPNKVIFSANTSNIVKIDTSDGKLLETQGQGNVVLVTASSDISGNKTIYLSGDLNDSSGSTLPFFSEIKVIPNIANFSGITAALSGETSSSPAPFYLANILGDDFIIYDSDNDLFILDPEAKNKITLIGDNDVFLEDGLSNEDVLNSTSRYKIFPVDFGNIEIGTNVTVGNTYKFNYYQTQAGTQYSDRVQHFGDFSNVNMTFNENGQSYTMKTASQNVTVGLGSILGLGVSILKNDNEKFVNYLHVNAGTGRTYTFDSPINSDIFNPETGILEDTVPFTVEGAGTFRVEVSRQGTGYTYFIGKSGFKETNIDNGAIIGLDKDLTGTLITTGFGDGKIRFTSGSTNITALDGLNFNSFDNHGSSPFFYGEITIILPDGTYRYVTMDNNTTDTDGTISFVGDIYDTNGMNNISTNWDQPSGDYKWYAWPVGKVPNGSNDFGVVINSYGGVNDAPGALLMGDVNTINSSGRYAITQGRNNVVSERYLAAIGDGIIANRRAGSEFGQFNVQDTDNGNQRKFGVGVGTSDVNRIQGLEVRMDGLVYNPSATNDLISSANSKVLITKEFFTGNTVTAGIGITQTGNTFNAGGTLNEAEKIIYNLGVDTFGLPGDPSLFRINKNANDGFFQIDNNSGRFEGLQFQIFNSPNVDIQSSGEISLSSDNNQQIRLGNPLGIQILPEGTATTPVGSVLTQVTASGFAKWQAPSNEFITGQTFSNSTYDLTTTTNSGNTFVNNLAALASDRVVTGGTYNNTTGVISFGTNSGTTFDVAGFVTGFTDTVITGGTFDSTGGTITLTDNQNNVVTVSGFSSDLIFSTSFSGLTPVGDTNKINIIQDPNDDYNTFLHWDNVNDEYLSILNGKTYSSVETLFETNFYEIVGTTGGFRVFREGNGTATNFGELEISSGANNGSSLKGGNLLLQGGGNLAQDGVRFNLNQTGALFEDNTNTGGLRYSIDYSQSSAATSLTLATVGFVTGQTINAISASIGDELYFDGSNWVKVTPVKGSTTGTTGTTFTLPSLPVSGSTVDLFKNGLIQDEGITDDYTRTGTNVTFITPLNSNDKILYKYKTL